MGGCLHTSPYGLTTGAWEPGDGGGKGEGPVLVCANLWETVH